MWAVCEGPVSGGCSGGRCPPDPLGFIALMLLQQKGSEERAGRPRSRPPGPSAVCSLQTALRSLPSVALPSAGEKGAFPVSVSLGVYRLGNGQRELELITLGQANDGALVGEF